MDPASLVLLAALAAPAPQAVFPDRNQQFTVPRAEPKLPSDAELAKVKVPAELLRLARELDAATLAERRSARDAIEARKPTPEELMALLLRGDLSIESRHLLVGILRDRILYAPRGALGIRMENLPDPAGGVRIIGLVPGMPAEKVLKVGDVIRRVNDSVLRHTGDLVNAVQSLPPGVDVTVVVQRLRAGALDAKAPGGAVEGDGRPIDPMEEITVALRLGSTEELDERGAQLGGVNAGAVVVGGRAMNSGVLTFERVATARAAADRFLPKPEAVRFPQRIAEEQNRPPATVESVRRLLVEMQLQANDLELVRDFRRRLDGIAAQLPSAVDDDTRAKLQALLQELELEIRSAM